MEPSREKITHQSDTITAVKFTPLEDRYVEFERTINCTNGQPPAYAHLSHFNGNKSKPIHRWFAYKEGVSSELLTWVCQTVGLKFDELESLLDPYVGVVISLLSAQMAYRGTHPLHLVGIERNPFVVFAARAKLNWPIYDVKKIQKLIPKSFKQSRRGRAGSLTY